MTSLRFGSFPRKPMIEFQNNLHQKLLSILTLRQIAKADEFAMTSLDGPIFSYCPPCLQTLWASREDQLTQARYHLGTFELSTQKAGSHLTRNLAGDVRQLVAIRDFLPLCEKHHQRAGVGDQKLPPHASFPLQYNKNWLQFRTLQPTRRRNFWPGAQVESSAAPREQRSTKLQCSPSFKERFGATRIVMRSREKELIAGQGMGTLAVLFTSQALIIHSECTRADIS